MREAHPEVMRAIRMVLALPLQVVLTLSQITLLLVAAHLAVRFCSLSTLLKALRFSLHHVRPLEGPPSAAAIAAWAMLIQAVDRHLYREPSCLRQSLTLNWLLSRCGVTSTIKIGVSKARHELEAHAWLEVPGSPLLALFADHAFSELLPAPYTAARASS
jgi:hypothetical protein